MRLSTQVTRYRTCPHFHRERAESRRAFEGQHGQLVCLVCSKFAGMCHLDREMVALCVVTPYLADPTPAASSRLHDWLFGGTCGL